MSESSNSITTELTLVKMLGMDDAVIADRISQMDLSDGDIPLLNLLVHKVIAPNITHIIEQFYEFLFRHADIRHYLTNKNLVKRLKVTQAEYLLSFGSNFHCAEYFEYRLRVGIAHARIQLPMHLYLGAYAKMQALIQQSIFNSSLSQDPELIAKCFGAISKIILLDISLAMDAYSHVTLRDLAKSMHELEVQKNQLTNQLMHDGLTGALSRAYILDILGKKLAQLQRRLQNQISIALIDIDHFKRVNDSYGHPIGDAVLKYLTQFVNDNIRHQDYFGRFGGEEFLLVIVDSDADNAYAFVERIRRRLAEQDILINDNQINITISIGLSHVTEKDTLERLIERTDKALYKAKSAGRNRTIIS